MSIFPPPYQQLELLPKSFKKLLAHLKIIRCELRNNIYVVNNESLPSLFKIETRIISMSIVLPPCQQLHLLSTSYKKLLATIQNPCVCAYLYMAPRDWKLFKYLIQILFCQGKANSLVEETRGKAPRVELGSNHTPQCHQTVQTLQTKINVSIHPMSIFTTLYFVFVFFSKRYCLH